MKNFEKLADLIAINSIYDTPTKNAPFGKGNRRALDVFLSISREYGFEVGDDNGYAAWAEYGDGEKLVGVLGHLDVVPVGEGWKSDPFVLTVRDGNMYGRGVSDDKGPLFACLLALKRIKDEKIPLGARVRIIAGCNEENGSACIKHYAEHCEIPSVSFTPDSDFPVVASEKGILHLKITLPRVESGILTLRGGLRPNIVPGEAECKVSPELFQAVKDTAAGFTYRCGKIVAHGKSAHGSTPEKGDNAVLKLLALLSPFAHDDCVDWACKHFSENFGLDCEDESGKLTVNLGVCDFGEVAEFVVDLRLPACADPQDIIAKIRSTLPSNGKIDVLHRSDALRFDEDDKLITALMRVYREVTGDCDSRPLHIGGGTYAKELPNCAAFGAVFPGVDTRMHEPNEFYPIDDFDKLVEIYYRAMIALAKM